MAIWDNPVDTFFGGGKAAGAGQLEQGANNAANYMRPYYDGGVEDYGRYRGDMRKFGDQLEQYGNPMDQFWKNASKNPNAYYDELMSGYQESPTAKYQQEAAMRAANNGASASGMMGSGAYFDTLQQNANDISQRDQQQYYQNIMNTLGAQFGFGQNFQGQQNEYRRGMSGLADYGFRAGDSMARWEMEAAKARAAKEEAESGGWENFGGNVLKGIGNYYTGGLSGVVGGITGAW